VYGREWNCVKKERGVELCKKKRGVKFFSIIMLVEGVGNQLKYESCSHLLKTSGKSRKEVHTCLLALLGTGAWHLTI
jgi:hypothetical protein